MRKYFTSLLATSSLLMISAHDVFAASDAHHSGDHAEAGSGGLPQLDPSSYASQVFWLVIVFVLLYIFFSRKTLPDISQTVEGRAERIKNDLDTAERVKKEVQDVQENYNAALGDARQKSQDLFKSVEADIKKRTDDFNSSFLDKSQNLVADTEKEIDAARKKALKDMETIAAEVAAKAASKIIGVEADTKSVKAIAESVNKAA